MAKYSEIFPRMTLREWLSEFRNWWSDRPKLRWLYRRPIDLGPDDVAREALRIFESDLMHRP
jgi:hypothetical protein